VYETDGEIGTVAQQPIDSQGEMNNMKNTASTSKLSNFLAELNLVLAGSHNLPLDDDCTW
jgi:hypothetical protein